MFYSIVLFILPSIVIHFLILLLVVWNDHMLRLSLVLKGKKSVKMKKSIWRWGKRGWIFLVHLFQITFRFSFFLSRFSYFVYKRLGVCLNLYWVDDAEMLGLEDSSIAFCITLRIRSMIIFFTERIMSVSRLSIFVKSMLYLEWIYECIGREVPVLLFCYSVVLLLL